MATIKYDLPLIPLRDVVIFPGVVSTLFVGRNKSINALNAAMAGEKKIILAAQKDGSIDAPLFDDLFKVATVASIVETLEPEDLVKFGLIPEFVGRLPVISTLHELDEEALVRILQEPKNALVNQYKYLFEIDEVELDFRKEALVEIAKRALKRKTGARGLRSIMEELLMDTMFELPNEDLEKVIVDENSVLHSTDPIKVYKTPKKKSSSAG